MNCARGSVEWLWAGCLLLLRVGTSPLRDGRRRNVWPEGGGREVGGSCVTSMISDYTFVHFKFNYVAVCHSTYSHVNQYN